MSEEDFDVRYRVIAFIKTAESSADICDIKLNIMLWS